VFMSSLAMNGEGRGIVIRTGTQDRHQDWYAASAGVTGHNHSVCCACALWSPDRLARVAHVRQSLLTSMYPVYVWLCHVCCR
jgi:hypothetical protein